MVIQIALHPTRLTANRKHAGVIRPIPSKASLRIDDKQLTRLNLAIARQATQLASLVIAIVIHPLTCFEHGSALAHRQHL